MGQALTPELSLVGLRYDPDPVAKRAWYDAPTLPPNPVFLIHGYNKRAVEAQADYGTFERLLAEASEGRMDGKLVRVHWPGLQGDVLVPSLLFARSAKLAERSVTPFVEFLEERLLSLTPNSELVLVAHSLGCLLATEAAKQLVAKRPSARIVLFLMGAAIPVSGQYAALGTIKTRAVLFSPEDKILRKIFPLGHFMHSGRWSKAVGLSGGLNKDDPAWNPKLPMSGYGHSDYWSGRAAAKNLCASLHCLATHETPEAERPTVAALAEHDLPEREMRAERAPASGRPGMARL